MTGNRNNEGKPKISLIFDAPLALSSLAAVLEHGAKKYGRGNWLQGLVYTEIVDSLARHTLLFMNGEELDEESGLPHVSHMMANTLFLAQLHLSNSGTDDRPASESLPVWHVPPP